MECAGESANIPNDFFPTFMCWLYCCDCTRKLVDQWTNL